MGPEHRAERQEEMPGHLELVTEQINHWGLIKRLLAISTLMLFIGIRRNS